MVREIFTHMPYQLLWIQPHQACRKGVAILLLWKMKALCQTGSEEIFLMGDLHNIYDFIVGMFQYDGTV